MDKNTPSLFDDIDNSGPETQGQNSLTISVGREKKLSKKQRTFNKLTKRIEQLQETILTETAKLEALFKIHMAEIPEKKLLLAQRRLTIAKSLVASTKTIKYSTRQFKRVREVILVLCNEAFADMEPDEETERFYDEWSDTSYREELRSETDMINREFAERAQDIFGIDIGLDNIDDSPEGIARLAARLQNEFEDMWKKEGGPGSRQKRTKKQLKHEELRKREEELTQRSMRSIFLSLAKALHPDTITDVMEKARKEELMKKVTAAYAEKDLATLLKLEMEWIRSEDRSLDTLPDEQLKLYILSLREQADALEQELEALYMHPRFEDIWDLAQYPKSFAIQQIREIAKDYTRVARSLDEITKFFLRPSPKKHILDFVNEYIDVIHARNPFEEDFPDDFF